MVTIGIVDTMFSRINMGEIALDELSKTTGATILRRTVPGIKDLAVECQQLLTECDIAIALGMIGSAPIDLQCAHEASTSLQAVKLRAGKHILEVFIHENEAWSEKELLVIAENRIRKHAQNALQLVQHPEKLIAHAGKGVRQGKQDEGALDFPTHIRIGIVASKFNAPLTEKMKAVALAEAKKQNIEIIETIEVPGAFDAPLAIKKLLMDKRVDGVVVLGAVVKGETRHDEVIVFNLANTLHTLSLEFHKPVTLGVIGPGVTWKQAEARAESYAKNAVNAAVDLIRRLRR